jgi:pantetheine-phosphate adenylyltransferase
LANLPRHGKVLGEDIAFEVNPMNRRLAVYPGTFDPIHLGHLDIITRGLKAFDRILVGVGINIDKKPLLSLEDRVSVIQEVVRQEIPEHERVEVKPFRGLAVRFVREAGSSVMLRGLRTTSDMEYEFTMSLANMTLDPDIETVFLMAKDTYSHLSSSLLRQIASFGGDMGKFLPKGAVELVRKRYTVQPD